MRGLLSLRSRRDVRLFLMNDDDVPDTRVVKVGGFAKVEFPMKRSRSGIVPPNESYCFPAQ